MQADNISAILEKERAMPMKVREETPPLLTT
jgi:hypothetical protein